jgi:hypothetical protein
MGHERWFRGQHDAQNRPFDWLTPARQHGIPWQRAKELYEQAVQRAHGAAPGRVQEIYLGLLAEARRRDASRPSPGKVTRTMRLEAERAGKRRGPRVARLTGQPIAPGKCTLISYIEPAEHERRARDAERKTATLPSSTAPAQDISVPGTAAHRRFQANLAASFGHFEELEALQEERLDVEPTTARGAWQPRDVDAGDTADAEQPSEWRARPMPLPSPRTPAQALAVDAVRGASGPLPYLDIIQSAFGHHDITNVQASTGSQARRAGRALGASAFAVGERVALGDRTDLHTVAHEAAHVVQQRGGVRTRGELGPRADAYERHADEVAALVARGRSAEHVLDRMARPGRQMSSGIAIQRLFTTAHPEDCPTYEIWLATFADLPSFRSSDGTHRQVPVDPPSQNPDGTPVTRPPRQRHFQVLGGRLDEEHPTVIARRPPEDGSPPPPHDSYEDAPQAIGPQARDRFIDHPTEAWVQANLPPELRVMAYQLPADCADVMLILRHVWLQAHGRTEQYRHGSQVWVIGRGAGATEHGRRDRIRGLIVDQVSSGSVAAMVNPYTDAAGTPLRSVASLAPLLHPGDLLVWEHRLGSPGGQSRHRGGHSQTIQSVTRGQDPAAITDITCIQGNQPLFEEEAEDIRAVHGERAGSERELGDAPGRRLERSIITGARLQDLNGVWTWIDRRDSNGNIIQFTVLVAAGPPRTAVRPAPQQAGAGGQRSLRDWLSALQDAPNLERLQARFEAALQEARATIEGGGAVAPADGQALGRAAGERLWALAHRAGDLGNASHFEPLHQLRQVIRALGGIDPVPTTPNPHAESVRALFTSVDDAFHMAARGATSIDFQRDGQIPTRRVLLVGFDPFGTDDNAPSRGAWNSSGPAVMALDGETLRRGSASIAVESVVLPVSFNEFSGDGTSDGIVERIIRPWAGRVDAVITVSMDRNVHAPAPVQLEQFSVGMRMTRDMRGHQTVPVEHHRSERVSIPPPPGGTPGPPLIETSRDLDLARLAQDTAHEGRRGGVQAPIVDTSVVLGFTSRSEAEQALGPLGLQVDEVRTRHHLPGEPRPFYTRISDVGALRQIMATQAWQGTGNTFSFQAGGRTFTADLIRGPGGSFLSNEVAFRTQQLLSQQTGSQPTRSFHVHTPNGEEIPEQGTAAGRRAQQQASELRTQLIATLRAMIRALVQQMP